MTYKIIIGSLFASPVLILIISNIILAGLLALTYTSLTKEEVVAVLVFDNMPEQKSVYTAHLYDNKHDKINDFIIYGDQWRMDAAFIKVEYWANILGVDSKYILNRIEGRYHRIEDENMKKHQSYEIESHNIIDLFPFFVDTQYGSSVYQKIHTDTEYTVLKSPTGLMVREKSLNQEKNLWEKTKSFL